MQVATASVNLGQHDAALPRWQSLPTLTEMAQTPQVVLSFDVEEHFRIEAAAGLAMDADSRAYYCRRLENSTCWLLDQLAQLEIAATFFVVGETAQHHPDLIRQIADAGHEVASHSWDHQRLHLLTPAAFREDVRKSKDTLEQLTGREVLGYRAPTFSIGPRTSWAVDVLAELGFEYDSSIYPIWHDRYGIPKAPRGPFRARGSAAEMLELPPATWRKLGMNIPAGGGGYFRLLPLSWVERAIRQISESCNPAVATLYFHPWDFDPQQERLPLNLLSALRTYVGISRTRDRLLTLLRRRTFTRAIDAARQMQQQWSMLPIFDLEMRTIVD